MMLDKTRKVLMVVQGVFMLFMLSLFVGFWGFVIWAIFKLLQHFGVV